MRHETYENGRLIDFREVEEDPEVVNARQIRERAVSAMQNNRDFLAKSSPTNAELATQVKALTRQTQGLIRMALNQFDGTD